MPRLSLLLFAMNCIRAARVIRGTGSASASKIARYLDVSHSQACDLLMPLTAMGIVQPADHAGFRKVNRNLGARALLFVFAVGGRTKPRRLLPNWSGIDSYTELDRIATACAWLDADGFINGPFNRFMDMGCDHTLPARARGRIMEYARQSLLRHRAAMIARGEPTAFLDDYARSHAQERLSVSDDRKYLLAVLDGLASHNSLAR